MYWEAIGMVKPPLPIMPWSVFRVLMTGWKDCITLVSEYEDWLDDWD
jgi:hypothetical protein